ncbi:hypothetical protein EDB89DRAFT_833766 [Lactarius sanguifluus]|nr:hypothetical protein EDB89DRAFT_833766 [Lactarius sanguifluus]
MKTKNSKMMIQGDRSPSPCDPPGSGDEDVDDEALQVVVLKEGKHLSEGEAQNEKHKGETEGCEPPETVSCLYLIPRRRHHNPRRRATQRTLRRSRQKKRPRASRLHADHLPTKPTTAKRKAIGDGRSEGSHVGAPAPKGKTKKPKVGLSFADDA